MISDYKSSARKEYLSAWELFYTVYTSINEGHKCIAFGKYKCCECFLFLNIRSLCQVITKQYRNF